MSKPNKVNKTNYVQRGRLTPDELARERNRQGEMSSYSKSKEHIIGRIPSRPSERESTRPRNENEE
jgi:hypothetical protein